MDQFTLLEQSYYLIRKDLGLEEEMMFEKDENTLDRLVEFLVSQINYLLDHDLTRLLNALYRIDIPESKVKQILSHSKNGEIAKNLAEIIIDRQKQKIITRQQYQP